MVTVDPLCVDLKNTRITSRGFKHNYVGGNITTR